MKIYWTILINIVALVFACSAFNSTYHLLTGGTLSELLARHIIEFSLGDYLLLPTIGVINIAYNKAIIWKILGYSYLILSFGAFGALLHELFFL